jgi:hypothetical protein
MTTAAVEQPTDVNQSVPAEPVTTNLFEAYQAAPMFTEAPGIAFTKLYGLKDGQTIEINLTARANNPIEAIQQLMEAARFSKETYKLSLTNPNIRQSPGNSTQASTNATAPATSPAPNSPTSTTTAPVTSTNPADDGKIIHAVKMKVTPKADGKVTLEWFGNGRRFPDINKTCATDKAVTLLRSTGEDWHTEHLTHVAEYNIKHDVHWAESENKNSKGNPYKDIVKITVR